jgi:hypothetical protein
MDIFNSQLLYIAPSRNLWIFKGLLDLFIYAYMNSSSLLYALDTRYITPDHL